MSDVFAMARDSSLLLFPTPRKIAKQTAQAFVHSLIGCPLQWKPGILPLLTPTSHLTLHATG